MILKPIVLEWLLLAGGLILVSFPAVPFNLLLLAEAALLGAFALRAARSRRILPPNPVSLPWLVFLFTGIWGALISVRQDLAQVQLVRMLAAFVLFCALAEAAPRLQRRLAWVLLWGMAFTALYWPLKHQFAADPGKFSLISRIGSVLNSALPEPPGPLILPNVAAGMLALAVPFGAALFWISLREGRRKRTYLAAGLTALILACLLLTSSRGALLGLLAAVLAAALARAQVQRFPGSRQKRWFWGSLGLGAALLLAAITLTGNLDRLAGSLPDPTGTLNSRMDIWRQGTQMMRDYAFTGAGLSAFPIVFSVYRLLIHVPYHEHMHNILLSTWLQQGLVGLGAMVWGALAVLRVAWRALVPQPGDGEPISEAGVASSLGWAGMAALVSMGVHGMVDVVFSLQATLPLVGLVTGYLTLLWEPAGETAPLLRDRRLRIAIGSGAMLLVLALLIFQRPLRSAWYANLGALVQTRLELLRYGPDQFDRPTLDAVRREGDLSAVERYFQEALRLNPHNRTALARLALIELSRGEYDAAREHAERLVEAAPGDETALLLLGDSLVADENPVAAARTVRGLPWAADRLLFQAWFRYRLGRDRPRAAAAWQAVLLLDPGNREAVQRLEEIGER